MRRKVFQTLATLGMAIVLFPAAALAADLDGKASLVCASIDVVGCANGPGCHEGSADEFDLPQFLFVDFEKQHVHGTDETGIDVVSEVRNSEITEEQIILQGIENHRGWTMTIDRGDGDMTLSSSGAGVSFMIFGACTRR